MASLRVGGGWLGAGALLRGGKESVKWPTQVLGVIADNRVLRAGQTPAFLAKTNHLLPWAHFKEFTFTEMWLQFHFNLLK